MMHTCTCICMHTHTLPSNGDSGYRIKHIPCIPTQHAALYNMQNDALPTVNKPLNAERCYSQDTPIIKLSTP